MKNLVLYIHKNPENHNIVKNFEHYRFTSFQSYLNSTISEEKKYVLSLFEDIDNFKYAHESDLQGFETETNLQSHKNLLDFNKKQKTDL